MVLCSKRVLHIYCDVSSCVLHVFISVEFNTYQMNASTAYQRCWNAIHIRIQAKPDSHYDKPLCP